MYHIAKIIEVIPVEEKGTKSCESLSHSLVETWDGNRLIFKVNQKIAPYVKKGDFVLLDFSPVSLATAPVPRHEVVEIVNSTTGKKVWKEMKDYLEKKKSTLQNKAGASAQAFPNMGHMIR